MPKKSMLPGKTRLAAKIIKMLSLIWIIPCVIIAALWIKGRIEFVYDSFEKDSAAALQNLQRPMRPELIPARLQRSARGNLFAFVRPIWMRMVCSW